MKTVFTLIRLAVIILIFDICCYCIAAVVQEVTIDQCEAMEYDGVAYVRGTVYCYSDIGYGRLILEEVEWE